MIAIISTVSRKTDAMIHCSGLPEAASGGASSSGKRFLDRSGSVAFVVTQEVGQSLDFSNFEDQMDVIGHDSVGSGSLDFVLVVLEFIDQEFRHSRLM